MSTTRSWNSAANLLSLVVTIVKVPSVPRLARAPLAHGAGVSAVPSPFERLERGFAACYICAAFFIHGETDPGLEDEAVLVRLTQAFKSGGQELVKSLALERACGRTINAAGTAVRIGGYHTMSHDGRNWRRLGRSAFGTSRKCRLQSLMTAYCSRSETGKLASRRIGEFAS
jgi:hypothetical protein